MQDTKQTALDFLDRANEFVVFTDECVLINSSYSTIEKMILTACNQPQMKAMLVQTMQKVMRNDMLTMLN
jgi:hypothetical protein